MATTPDLKEVSRVLKQLLPAQYGAVLFGSRATGRARPGSDWDIGLIGPEPLGGAVIETIREELDELPTLHSFDVVDLRTVPDYFRQAALRGAKAILSAAILKEFEKEMTMPADGEANLTAFESALARLREVLAEPKSTIVRDAAIQRFEFTFELAWKTAMRVAQSEGAECGVSPKEVIKAAFRLGWIDDDKLWLEMLKDRNRTTHIYNEALADEIFSRLPGYLSALTKLHDQLKRVLESPQDDADS